jgi:hypothetical protein
MAHDAQVDKELLCRNSSFFSDVLTTCDDTRSLKIDESMWVSGSAKDTRVLLLRVCAHTCCCCCCCCVCTHTHTHTRSMLARPHSADMRLFLEVCGGVAPESTYDERSSACWTEFRWGALTLTLNTAQPTQWIGSLSSPTIRTRQELSNYLYIRRNGQRRVSCQHGQTPTHPCMETNAGACSEWPTSTTVRSCGSGARSCCCRAACADACAATTSGVL